MAQIIARRTYRRFESIRARLVACTDRRGPDECWPWTATAWSPNHKQAESRGWRPAQYGIFNIADGGRQYAHRATYTEFVGEIPAGYTIDHKCFNTICQNPRHLEAVPLADNTRRYITARRSGTLQRGV